MQREVRGLIILDRDGVLNRLVVHAEQGTVDSPLHPDQVELFPDVPETLQRLTGLGYALVIATNQPAAATGKTTRDNLEQVHERVLTLLGQPVESEVCWHRNEDQCDCRKPKPGLLLKAHQRYPHLRSQDCWMVGDGITDLQAAQAAGMHGVFCTPKRIQKLQVFPQFEVDPKLWVNSLSELPELLS